MAAKAKDQSLQLHPRRSNAYISHWRVEGGQAGGDPENLSRPPAPPVVAAHTSVGGADCARRGQEGNLKLKVTLVEIIFCLC